MIVPYVKKYNYDLDLAIGNIIDGKATFEDFKLFAPENTANRQAFYDATGIKLPTDSRLTNYNLLSLNSKNKNILDLYLNKKTSNTDTLTLPDYLKYVENSNVKDIYFEHKNALKQPDSLTENSESGKIKEMEYGVPYGEYSLKADLDYIYSKEYVSKYNLTENSEINNKILDYAQTAIKHRNGTKYEDMYIINAETGDVLGAQLDMKYESGISYNESILNALEKAKNEDIPIIALHNHPEGYPPSIDDFNKAYDNNYMLGIVVGHNGQVYLYNKPNNRIENPEIVHHEIVYRYLGGIDVERAYKEVYDLLGLEFSAVKGD